jgi:hypothetical protein
MSIVKACIMIAVILAAGISFAYFYYSNPNKFIEYSTWTKAVCEGNKCRDVKIYCLNGEIVSIQPITSWITFSEGFVDLRSEKERERQCDF